MPHLPRPWGGTTLRCMFYAAPAPQLPPPTPPIAHWHPLKGSFPLCLTSPPPSGFPGVTSWIIQILILGSVFWRLQTMTAPLFILLFDPAGQSEVDHLSPPGYFGEVLWGTLEPRGLTPPAAPGFLPHLGLKRGWGGWGVWVVRRW